jgi:hypothetical protein
MTNNREHFGYPNYIAPTDLSVANIIAHGGTIPFYDYAGQEFEVGQVVFFEFNTGYATLPRKGRIIGINPNKQKIKVISDKSGGYEFYDENESNKNSYWLSIWRKFWIDMWACPIIIGDKNDRICDC